MSVNNSGDRLKPPVSATPKLEHKFTPLDRKLRDIINQIFHRDNQSPREKLQELAALEEPSTPQIEPIHIPDTTEQDRHEVAQITAELQHPQVEVTITPHTPETLFPDRPSLYEQYHQKYARERKTIKGVFQRFKDIRRLVKEGIDKKDATEIYDGLRSRGISHYRIEMPKNDDPWSRSQSRLSKEDTISLLKQAPKIIDRNNLLGFMINPNEIKTESFKPSDINILTLSDQQFEAKYQLLKPFFFLKYSPSLIDIFSKQTNPQTESFLKYFDSHFLDGKNPEAIVFDSIKYDVCKILLESNSDINKNYLFEVFRKIINSDLNPDQSIEVPKEIIENFPGTLFDYNDKVITTLNKISNREEQKRLKGTETEQEIADRKLLEEINRHHQEKINRTRQERSQELSERLFNEKLTKLEDIDIDSSIEGSGVVKRQIEFIDNKGNKNFLTVYDMQGYPFSFLQHAINYKSIDNFIGGQTAKDLQNNPSLWSQPRDKFDNFGGQEADSKSNIICTSYINTEANFVSIDAPFISYGFDHILPFSIIKISGGDGGTPSYLNDEGNYLPDSFVYTPQVLEQATSSHYNEIVLKRYDSNGRPQLPDFLIIKDISFLEQKQLEIVLKHASYFNIPIINIETKKYSDKELKRLENTIDTINDNSGYEEINKVLDTINASYLFGTLGGIEIEDVGHSENRSPFSFLSSSLNNKIDNFLRIESSKRVNYIVKTIQEETKKIIQARDENKKYIPTTIREVKIQDNNGRYNTTDHTVFIRMISPSGKEILTKFHDGDTLSSNDKERDPKANSLYYNELKPLVDAYLTALAS